MSETRTTAHLFRPLTIRGVTFRNRVVMSPMCQYVATDGLADDWHLVHLGSRAAGGVGLVVVEATAVTPEGRIAPGDMGIWSDRHVEPLARIARFVASQGAVPGIQLAHSGRKGSCEPPWTGGARLPRDRGGWDVIAPGPEPFHPGDPESIVLDAAGVDAVIDAFEAAARRALAAGFRVIEIHAAHGYLINEFLTPLVNRRTDAYGGPFENRARLLVRVVERLRASMPDELPLFVRISATDWVEGGWTVDDSVALASRLKPIGVDLIDASSGATVPDAKIPVGPGYQVSLARRIKERSGILTGAVGMITEAEQADALLADGSADLVFVGRELLREPYWTLKAAQALDAEPDWPTPYGYAVKRRGK